MKNLISVNEAVRRSQFCRQTIYNLVREGKIKFARRGWEIWVDWRSLSAYRARRRALDAQGAQRNGAAA